jgi:hypothetical protein
MTCSFYTGSYPEEARAPKAVELLKLGEWNRNRVKAKGDPFTVWLNGEQVSRYTSDKYHAAGPIGLRIHDGLVMKRVSKTPSKSPLMTVSGELLDISEWSHEKKALA